VTDGLTYSTFGELSTYQASSSGSPQLNVQYTRDSLGRITQKLETIGGATTTTVYGYDQAGRLTDVTVNGALSAHYDYDGNGNRLAVTRPGTGTVSGTYDAQDRLVTYGAVNYTCTANGDLQTVTSGGQTTTYTYDVFGNPTAVSLPNGTQIEYVIDGQNRRIGKKVNGTLAQGFLYRNQLAPVAELDGAGNVVSRFIYGTRINVPDYMVRAGTTYRLLTDHLGSVRLVLDTATGATAQRLDYDEFGQITQDTNAGFQPFGFAGGLYDQHTKLTRFGARDYDAFTGRWTTKDPIRFAAGDVNLYGYVLNDPVTFVDPTGLLTFRCFSRNFKNNLDVTNDFFFGGLTQLTRTGIGALTSGAVARTTGLTSLGRAARALAGGTGVANLTIGRTIASVALNSLVNGALVAASLEGGIIVGSAASALGQALAGECPPEPQPKCRQ